jgi:hypothetical protein
MKFKIVNFRADRISGWCQAPSREVGKARVDLLLGGVVVDSFLARNFRAELPAHDFADRNLGFLGTLPPQYWDGQTYPATLREQTTGTVLVEGDLHSEDARISSHPGLSGAAALGEAGQINGWASYQGSKVPVHLIIDSHTVLTAVADLHQLPKGKEQHKIPVPAGWAFSLQVPPEYFDGAEHRIQITVDAQSGSAVIFDQVQRLLAEKAETADINIQQIDARRPDNFPLPGLRVPADWNNRWKVSNPALVSTRIDHNGRLRLSTTHDEPVYLMLNALPRDLRKLDAQSGVGVGAVRAYRAGMRVSHPRGMRLQLGIYEYEALGHNIERTLVEAGQRGLFVANPQTARMLVLIRAVGPGAITIGDLELVPAEEVRSADPGFHPLEESQPLNASSLQETYADGAEFVGENHEINDGATEAPSAQLAPVLNSLLTTQQQLQAAIAELSAHSELLNRRMEGVRAHLAQQHLQEVFSSDDAVEILPLSGGAASQPVEGPDQ